MQVEIGQAEDQNEGETRSAPGATRSFSKLSNHVSEVVNARVYERVHYRSSGEIGAVIGRELGQHTCRIISSPSLNRHLDSGEKQKGEVDRYPLFFPRHQFIHSSKPDPPATKRGFLLMFSTHS